MKALFSLLIFCIVLFIYLHIHFHLKVSDDLEVYEIDQPSKDKLEEICDLRQPVIFNYDVDGLVKECNINKLQETYGAFDIKVRNVKDYDDNNELYLPLTLNTTVDVFRKDSEERYLSENNIDFLQETTLIKNYQYNDGFLRPSSVCNCMYDLMFSSKDTKTPLKYELNYRNYYLVTEGSVKIKLIPPKSSKYLYEIKDYDNFEFLSPVNVWNVQAQFKPDFDKLKTLDVTIRKGQIINIPAYWWYSIHFTENSSISTFKYRTYMNNIAILNHLVVKLLQSQNVKREIVKKNDSNTDNDDNTDNTDNADSIFQEQKLDNEVAETTNKD